MRNTPAAQRPRPRAKPQVRAVGRRQPGLVGEPLEQPDLPPREIVDPQVDRTAVMGFHRDRHVRVVIQQVVVRRRYLVYTTKLRQFRVSVRTNVELVEQ